GAHRGDHRHAHYAGRRSPRGAPPLIVPLHPPRRLHRAHHHPPLPPLRVHLHGSSEHPRQSSVAGGHRLRDHRGRRRHHDGKHHAPAERAQGHWASRGARGGARRRGGGAAAHLRRAHHHDGLPAHRDLPTDRGEALPPHGRHHLPGRGRLPHPHPHPHPRA